GRRLTADHVDFIRRVGCDVLALQEAVGAFHNELESLQLFQWSVSSLTLRPPEPNDGRARRLGCSLFGRSPFRLKASHVLTNLALPERSLVVVADSDSGPVTLGSFHTPPGANWGGRIKSQTLTAIAEWLSEQKGNVVFGIDANAPKTDHPSHKDNKWWRKGEPVLLGSSPAHQLQDAYRLFL